MTNNTIPVLLRFVPALFERPWGGRALGERFQLTLPNDNRFGEAWLISDHPHHESVVAEGPLQGDSLRTLMQRHAKALLGTVPMQTAQGRFPLLLKLLDAQDILSVQVHPDDVTAERLGENDGGKTEMWHVLAATSDSEIIAGLEPTCTLEVFDAAVADGTLAEHLVQLPVNRGDSIYVPSGTVHAIGSGILLAEIQQNSDLTYRIYDFDRIGPDGTRRQLHLDAARQVIGFGEPPASLAQPIEIPPNGAERRTLEAACPFFATERVQMDGTYRRETGGRSFHLLLAIDGSLTVSALEESTTINPGEAVLVAGNASEFSVTGNGVFLDYFVADIQRDILVPVRSG